MRRKSIEPPRWRRRWLDGNHRRYLERLDKERGEVMAYQQKSQAKRTNDRKPAPQARSATAPEKSSTKPDSVPNQWRGIGIVRFEPRVGASGRATNFALSIPTGHEENTTVIRCVAWKEDCGDQSRLREGDRIYVEGPLVTRSYDKDGSTVRVTEVKARAVKRLAAAPTPDADPEPAAEDDIPF